MFRSKRRFDNDLGCEWKEPAVSLDQEFERILEDADFYLFRHWFLKCATAPFDSIFYEKEDVKKYICESVLGGDALEIWSILQDKSVYVYCKMPDMDGLIPVSGCAY